MLGYDPNEDPDAAVDRHHERLAPDASRSPSTLLERQAALEDVSPAVRNAENYPAFLAAVVEVLNAEAHSASSDAATLFGMRTASRTVRRQCVHELNWFDLDRRLESTTQPAADDRLLGALAAVVRDGDALPTATDSQSLLRRSPGDASLPTPVAVALDELLFASPADRVRRHAVVLEAARHTVVDRILAADPDDVARPDVRVAATLSTQRALDAPDGSRADALAAHLTASTDAVVQAWGCMLAAHHDEETRDQDGCGDDLPGFAAFVDAVHAVVDEQGDEGAVREAAWALGRAAARTDAPAWRSRHVDALCTLPLNADRDVHGPVLEVLTRLATAGVLAERDAPMLFETACDGLTTTHELARRPAAELVDALLATDVVPAAFLDRVVASLAGDATSDDRAVARGALGGLRRLFEVEFDGSSLKHPAIADALTPSARRHLLNAAETVLFEGDDETVTDAARALRDVAHAAPGDDPGVREAYDRVLKTAIDDTGDPRTRACTAIAQALPWRALHPSQAERFLADQTPANLAGSPDAIRATTGILSAYGAPDALDLDTYADALVDRIPDLSPEAFQGTVESLEAIAEARHFNDPADGIELLAAAADVLARRYRSEAVHPAPTRELARIVDAVPSPDATTALQPLVARLRGDDPHARRAVVDVLGFATPDDGGLRRDVLTPDDPLLSGALVHPLVHPLVDHVTRGDVEDGIRGGTLSLLGQYAAREWLTDAHLDAVANLALDVLDEHPSSATTLLERPAVVERLGPADADRVFQRYVTSLEPPDRDPSETIVSDGDADDVPNGALDVLSTLLESGRATPAAFLDAVPIRELGVTDAPSITRHVTAASPPTPMLLSLLERCAERTDRSLAPLARPLEEVLASKALGDRNHLTVLALRTRLASTARFDTA